MKATWNGAVVAESDDTVLVEGNHYFPEGALNRAFVTFSNHRTTCPWKGEAKYLSLLVNGELNADAAWYYPDPKPEAENIRVMHGAAYFPPIAPAGTMQAQMFSSSPSSGSESMQLMYHLAITAAEHSIDFSVAYFVPDDLTRKLLTDALQRGVRLRFITPGEHTDTETVKAASRAT